MNNDYIKYFLFLDEFNFEGLTDYQVKMIKSYLRNDGRITNESFQRMLINDIDKEFREYISKPLKTHIDLSFITDSNFEKVYQNL